MTTRRSWLISPEGGIDWATGEPTPGTNEQLEVWELREWLIDSEGPEVVMEQWLTEEGWGDPQVQDNHGDLEVIGIDPVTGRPGKAWVEHVLDLDEAPAECLRQVLDLYRLDGIEVVTEEEPATELAANVAARLGLPVEAVGEAMEARGNLQAHLGQQGLGQRLLVFDLGSDALWEDLVDAAMEVAEAQGRRVLVVEVPTGWEPDSAEAELVVDLDEPDWRWLATLSEELENQGLVIRVSLR